MKYETTSLVLDFGNTNRKFALFENGRMIYLENHPDVNLSLVRQFVADHPGIRRCILSSVIRHPVSIENFLRKKFFFIDLNTRIPVPVKIRYLTPETLGNDRIACAVAAHLLYPRSPVLVVNAGTCITYDYVTAKGEYLGGAISPGLQMRFAALHTFTGQLPLVTLSKSPVPLTGRDSVSSIRSGVVNGIVSEIEGAVLRYREENPRMKVILSGGDMDYFAGKLNFRNFAIPEIVIRGLYQILVFNAKGS